MSRPSTEVPDWASDATFTSGAESGNAVKLTPTAGQLSQGHVPGTSFKGQFANYIMHWVRAGAEWCQDELKSLLDNSDNGSRGNTELAAYIDLVNQGVYGDGSDGNVTITGGTTTPTRDMYYDNLTITATGVLAIVGRRIFVKNTLTIESGGSITAAGAAGSGSTAGTGGGGDNQFLGAGRNGGGGGAGGGSAGTNIGDSIGGAGGAGGLGTAGAGGAGGTATFTGTGFSGYRHLGAHLGYLYRLASTDNLYYRPGAGGGGGGGAGAPNPGGGGGGGGGGIVLCCQKLDNAGTITAAGGAGAAGTATDAGGGGGGGGGFIMITYRVLTALGTVTAAGGAGGASGGGTGVAGSAGSDGTVVTLRA